MTRKGGNTYQREVAQEHHGGAGILKHLAADLSSLHFPRDRNLAQFFSQVWYNIGRIITT